MTPRIKAFLERMQGDPSSPQQQALVNADNTDYGIKTPTKSNLKGLHDFAMRSGNAEQHVCR
jgi:hypothetical protein